MGRRTTRHPARRIVAAGDVRREVATLAVEERFKDIKPGEALHNHYTFELTAQVRYWD